MSARASFLAKEQRPQHRRCRLTHEPPSKSVSRNSASQLSIGTNHVTVEALIDDWEGFRVLLRCHESNRLIRIAVDAHMAYQNRDEGDLAGEAGRSSGLGRGSFYIVANSEFAQRFASDSTRQFKTMTHYAIVTDVDCIDVLAAEEPAIDLV